MCTRLFGTKPESRTYSTFVYFTPIYHLQGLERLNGNKCLVVFITRPSGSLSTDQYNCTVSFGLSVDSFLFKDLINLRLDLLML